MFRQLDHLHRVGQPGAVGLHPQARRATDRKALVLAQRGRRFGTERRHRQHAGIRFMVIDRPQQQALAVVQRLKYLRLLVEEIIHHGRRQHRIIGGVQRPRRPLDILERVDVQILEQVFARRSAPVQRPGALIRVLQIQRRPHRRRTIGKVVAVDRAAFQPLKTQQSLIHLDPVGVDRNHQVPGIEVELRILPHEFHQRKHHHATGFAKRRIHRQRRDFGDIAAQRAQPGQIKYRLQRKTEHALADDADGAHHLAVPFGAQRGGGRQRVVDGHPQPRRVGFHETGGHVGIVQDAETGLQFVLGLGDLQFKPGIGRWIAVDHGPVQRKTRPPRQVGQSAAHAVMRGLSQVRQDRALHGGPRLSCNGSVTIGGSDAA